MCPLHPRALPSAQGLPGPSRQDARAWLDKLIGTGTGGLGPEPRAENPRHPAPRLYQCPPGTVSGRRAPLILWPAQDLAVLLVLLRATV